MAIKIEKGIPIPQKQTRNGTLEALQSMEVGDSFLYKRSAATGLYPLFKRAPGRKFVVRTIDKASVRVWRTE